MVDNACVWVVADIVDVEDVACFVVEKILFMRVLGSAFVDAVSVEGVSIDVSKGVFCGIEVSCNFDAVEVVSAVVDQGILGIVTTGQTAVE